ncbi:MAG: hypothetical protein HY042_01470 [Spirochaetia bacterium]|nr:hypothetical protein [Spirochaetia bacterium]
MLVRLRTVQGFGAALIIGSAAFFNACSHGGGGGMGFLALLGLGGGAPVAQYQVSGTVTGLPGGSTNSIALQLNGTESVTVSSNTTFQFTTKLANTASYKVLVTPATGLATGPGAYYCMASANSGTIASSSVTNVKVVCSNTTATLKVNVSGLSTVRTDTIVFQNNGTNDLSVTTNGLASFTAVVPVGADYNVTAVGQAAPDAQVCTPSGNTGTMAGGGATVAVACSPNYYTISGTYTTLNGSGLQIKLNNTGEVLTYNHPGSASGVTAFAFVAPVSQGTNYAVVVSQQPSGLNQTCGVVNGSGTNIAGNVTNVTITCVTNPYSVSGTVTGMAGSETLVLLMNGASNQTVGPLTTTSFSWNLVDGATYAVSVQGGSDTAIGKTCSVTNGTGTIAGGNVSNVSISCAFNTYTVGGSVSGLCSNQSIQVQNNGGNTQTVAGSSTFTFSAQNDLSAYNVTVVGGSVPANVSCSVTASGNLNHANITTVAVACTGCMSCAGTGSFTAHWAANHSYDVSTASSGGTKVYYDVSTNTVTTSSPGLLNVPNTTSTTQGVVTGRTSGCSYNVKILHYSSLNSSGSVLSGNQVISIP